MIINFESWDEAECFFEYLFKNARDGAVVAFIDNDLIDRSPKVQGRIMIRVVRKNEMGIRAD